MKNSMAALVSAIGFACVVTSASAQVPQTRPEPGNKPIETFTARAFQMQRGSSGIVEIQVTRWSTDAEREMLLGVLKEAGQPAMLAELQKLPQVGYFKMPNTMGVALFYARSNELPDGTRQVVLGTDRSIGMATRSPQASKYDATIIEIRFKKGEREGRGKDRSRGQGVHRQGRKGPDLQLPGRARPSQGRHVQDAVASRRPEAASTQRSDAGRGCAEREVAPAECPRNWRRPDDGPSASWCRPRRRPSSGRGACPAAILRGGPGE